MSGLQGMQNYLKGDRYLNPIMTNSQSNETVSASDVEKYGYCPLSWWLSEQVGDKEYEELEKGSQKHATISKDVKEIKTRDRVTKESERVVVWFSLIALVIGVNGGAIVYSIYAPISQGQIVMVLLAIVSVLWVLVAVLFFYYGIKMEIKTKSEGVWSQNISLKRSGDVDWKKRLSDAKLNTFLFFLVSGIIAMQGFFILLNPEPEQSQIRSWIFLVLALLWLIGSSIFYYISLKKEMVIKRAELKSGSPSEKQTFSESEKSVILFAVIATILASNALTFYQRTPPMVARILLVVAILWLYGGFIFLYRALRANLRLKLIIGGNLEQRDRTTKKKDLRAILGFELEFTSISYERGVFWFAMVAIILAINAIIINFSRNFEELYGALIARIIEAVAILWLIGAVFFLYMVLLSSKTATKLRDELGIEAGSIEYVDGMDGESESFYSERYGLRGRPDYILKKDGNLIPVEVKTGRTPRGPLFSHILQLAAYCLLIEDKYNNPPPYGIIKYSEAEHEIEYDGGLKKIILSKIVEMKEIMRTGEAHRNHKRESKCRSCSRRKVCPEKLV
jgi:CRISPR-associated exonuclease Cas4